MTSSSTVQCFASSEALEETKAGLRIKPPKTKRGRRNITLPLEAVAMLRERKQQLELRLALQQGGQPTLVFSTIEGKHLKPNGVIAHECGRPAQLENCRVCNFTRCATLMPRP